MNTFKDLYDFIDLAEKNHKYPKNTAHGRRAALKLFEKVLNKEELASTELIEKHIEDIYREAVQQYRNNFSITSLHTYKMRFMKILADYARYGADPNEIQRWNVKLRTVNKTVDKIDKEDNRIDDNKIDVSISSHTPVHKLEIALEGGGHGRIELPRSATAKDIKTIQNLLNSLAG